MCRSHARGHFGSSMSLRATLKDVRLPWLSSLASQNGATGGMTPNLQQVQFDEVYLHTAPGAVHRETHHDCAKWVPQGSDSERLGRSLAAEASAKIIQRLVTTTSASEQHREHLREASCVARKRGMCSCWRGTASSVVARSLQTLHERVVRRRLLIKKVKSRRT